jgi:soluble lytic murein transglycosylase
VRRFAVRLFAVNFLILWLGVLPFAGAQSQPTDASNTSEANQPAKKTSPKHAPAKAAGAKKATRTTPPSPKSATSAKARAASGKKKRKPPSPHVRRVRQAFVASSSLRPMAQQLLQDRTPSAYAGVEGYARRNCKQDAGSLAWLVVGYAHTLDHDYAKAIEPLTRAKEGASEVADYIAYYLGDAYQRTGHNSQAIATLADFSEKYPDSLLIRDAHLVYANALFDEGKAAEAAALLEKDRAPVRSDLELTIGRAYELAGDKEKAIAAFRNLYFNFPNSFEAEMAGQELRKLNITGTAAERRTRADLLYKA